MVCISLAGSGKSDQSLRCAVGSILVAEPGSSKCLATVGTPRLSRPYQHAGLVRLPCSALVLQPCGTKETRVLLALQSSIPCIV